VVNSNGLLHVSASQRSNPNPNPAIMNAEQLERALEQSVRSESAASRGSGSGAGAPAVVDEYCKLVNVIRYSHAMQPVLPVISLRYLSVLA